ncbi:MAG: hypothetical protein RL660_2371 [Bacteroidota bacterium]
MLVPLLFSFYLIDACGQSILTPLPKRYLYVAGGLGGMPTPSLTQAVQNLRDSEFNHRYKGIIWPMFCRIEARSLLGDGIYGAIGLHYTYVEYLDIAEEIRFAPNASVWYNSKTAFASSSAIIPLKLVVDIEQLLNVYIQAGLGVKQDTRYYQFFEVVSSTSYQAAISNKVETQMYVASDLSFGVEVKLRKMMHIYCEAGLGRVPINLGLSYHLCKGKKKNEAIK